MVLHGYHASQNLQLIGAWLLLAGGVGVVGGMILQFLDFKTQMKEAVISQVSITLFIAYARMWVYPFAAYEFYNELKGENAPQSLLIAAIVGISMLGLFNVMFVFLNAEKSYRYFFMLLSGETTEPTNDKEVIPDPIMYEDAIKASKKKF